MKYYKPLKFKKEIKMDSQQKRVVVSDFEKLLTESSATFLVNYKGLNVFQMESLRRDVREDGGVLKITKARLMKIAAQNVSKEINVLIDFKENFKNQVGLVFARGKEVSVIVKKLMTFCEESKKLEVVAGVFEKKFLTKEDIKILASLPSREVLLGMVAGTMQAPIVGFVRLLHQLVARLLYVLNEIGEKKQDEKV